MVALSQGKIYSSHAGLAIYLSSIYNYKCLDIYKKLNIWEGQFIEVTSNTINKKIILGNIWRPPRDIIENYQTFIEELYHKLVDLHKLKSEVMIAGDYNIDLLKIKEKT